MFTSVQQHQAAASQVSMEFVGRERSGQQGDDHGAREWGFDTYGFRYRPDAVGPRAPSSAPPSELR
jgi:hypothetical protein